MALENKVYLGSLIALRISLGARLEAADAMPYNEYLQIECDLLTAQLGNIDDEIYIVENEINENATKPNSKNK